MTRPITREEAIRIAKVMRLGNFMDGYIDEYNGKIQFFPNRPLLDERQGAGAYITLTQIEKVGDYYYVLDRWLREQPAVIKEILQPIVEPILR